MGIAITIAPCRKKKVGTVFFCGTLTVTIFLFFSSNFRTLKKKSVPYFLLKISKIGQQLWNLWLIAFLKKDKMAAKKQIFDFALPRSSKVYISTDMEISNLTMSCRLD